MDSVAKDVSGSSHYKLETSNQIKSNQIKSKNLWLVYCYICNAASHLTLHSILPNICTTIIFFSSKYNFAKRKKYIQLKVKKQQK